MNAFLVSDSSAHRIKRQPHHNLNLALQRHTANKALVQAFHEKLSFLWNLFTILSMAIAPQLGNCRVLNHPSFSIDLDHLSSWGQCVLLTSCILFSLESQSLTLSGADRPFSPHAHRIPHVLILPTPPVLLFVLPSL